nr:hypothetical protein [Mycobacterium sp. QGD 101]
MVSPALKVPKTASSTVRVPHATTVSIRSIGYPEGPLPPPTRPNAARFAGVSGVNIDVPSIAHTSRTRHRAAPAAGPRTRSNSSRSGLTPMRRRACANADDTGSATSIPSRPAVIRAHTWP